MQNVVPRINRWTGGRALVVATVLGIAYGSCVVAGVAAPGVRRPDCMPISPRSEGTRMREMFTSV